MPISVVARGRIVAGLTDVSSDHGLLASFMLGDAQFGIHRGVEYLLDDLAVVEVNCRGPFARQVLSRLAIDFYVVVVGKAHISQPLERYDDRDLVLFQIEAETVGIDLARQGIDPDTDVSNPVDGST